MRPPRVLTMAQFLLDRVLRICERAVGEAKRATPPGWRDCPTATHLGGKEATKCEESCIC